MRIKKLEIIGFKSFKDRTVIHFDAGITGIVGPNGCGKSNIVDALVWVMGEMSAKHLRGSSMEDVIFAGSEDYAPVGLSEVSLTLENDGGPFPAQYAKHSEIMVTRRLHRSGDSEYYINRETARLRDIQEIFMDTGAGAKGFSIIEQGAIGKIITAKPEDRRVLIEEAAGISKFKARKKESLRKLEATDQNLIRLQDIIGELKRQIDSLQRQAQRAERYRKLKREIESIELWFSSKQYLQLKTTADEAQKNFTAAETQELTCSTELTQFEAELQSLKAELSEIEYKTTQAQAEHIDLQSGVRQKENQLNELRFEISKAENNKERTSSLLIESKTRRDLLSQDLLALSERHTALREDSENLQTAFAEKNEIYEDYRSRISEVESELSDKRRELLTVTQNAAQIENSIASIEGRMQEIRKRRDDAEVIFKDLSSKQEEFEKRRNRVFNELENNRQLHLNIMNDVENFSQNKHLLAGQIEQKRTEVESCKDQLNEVSSRLYGLEDLHSNFEGFQDGVKNVMLWQRQKNEQSQSASTQYQPVAEVIEVPHQYELAMEAALGQRLQMLLTDSPQSSLEALSYLKENNSGRSSFFIGEQSSSESQTLSLPDSKEDGYVATLKDVITVPSRYHESVYYILNGVVVVNSIHAAMRLREKYPQCTFVTQDGDTLSQDGVLTGGTIETASSGVLKRRREIKELSQRREEWASKLSQAQVILKKLESQLQSVTQEWETAQKRSNEQDIKITELRKDYERAENEFDNANKAVVSQQKTYNLFVEETTKQETRFNELRNDLAQIRSRRSELEEVCENLNEELGNSRLGIESLQNEVMELKINSAAKTQELEGIRRQLEMVQKSVHEVEGTINKMSEESDKSSESLTQNQRLLEETRIEFDRLNRNFEEARLTVSRTRDEYEKKLADVRELDERVNSTFRMKAQLQSNMNDLKLKLETAKLKEQALIDSINERYMVNLAEVSAQYSDKELNMEEAESELSTLKHKISQIGEVNLSAIDEFEETKNRYEFLTKQHQDLIDAKEQLRRVIDRINRICSKRFRDTFESVNQRFVTVFPILFGGGEAQLLLHEDQESGEQGIDIVAKPPGKKMQNITLMSGGEKALTAVALIFSIFLVRPSPFCLLDEVDAPLDDANVYRFNDLVKEMAKRSQIILVTHNKHTMEVTEKLYGVTMEEKGISKMVSVSLSDAIRVVEA